MKPLPNFHIASLNSVEEALDAAKAQIVELAHLVLEEPGTIDVKGFNKNVDWIKRFYERAETLVINK